MQITQLSNPFSSQIASSKSNTWFFILVFGVIAAVGYFLYKENKSQLQQYIN